MNSIPEEPSGPGKMADNSDNSNCNNHIDISKRNRDTRTLSQILRSYSSDSTVHCLKYVIAQDRCVKKRVFWIIALITSVLFLVGTLLLQVIEMFSFPSNRALSVELRPELDFPGVTICNLNAARKSEVLKYPGMEELLLSTTDIDGVTNTSVWNGTLSSFQTIGEDQARTIREMAHTMDMTFIKCLWEGKDRTCAELFDVRPTEIGMCFTFNRYSDNHTQCLRSQTPGDRYGLHLTLNINQSEYVAAQDSSSAGFRVILHDFADTPLPRYQGFVIAPGYVTFANIHMRQIDYLSNPYPAYGKIYCTEPGQRHLKYFLKYDTNACRLECKLDYVIRRCGCKGIYDPDSVIAPFCDAAEYISCFTREEDNFWTNKTLQAACDCPPTCTRRIYDATISMSYFPSDEFAEKIKIVTAKGDIDRYRKDYLELKLYYSEYIYDHISQKPIYTFETISATLGGQMGLYMGVSVLSILELSEMIFNILCSACSKMFSRKTIEPGQD